MHIVRFPPSRGVTVRWGPFESVYAGHAARHSIGTGLTFSHDQALCLSILSLSLHVYFLTLRLTAVYSLTVRLAACLVLHYQAHILSLSGLLHVYTRRLAVIYSLTLTQARCLSILTLSGFCLSILTPADSLPIYSHTIRLTLYLFSHSCHCPSVFTPNAVAL